MKYANVSCANACSSDYTIKFNRIAVGVVYAIAGGLKHNIVQFKEADEVGDRTVEKQTKLWKTRF